jgi:hypothetical protein
MHPNGNQSLEIRFFLSLYIKKKKDKKKGDAGTNVELKSTDVKYGTENPNYPSPIRLANSGPKQR